MANGGYGAVNAAFGDPPDSTEQILHPEKYADREEPEGVTIPAGVVAALGGGWSIAGQDTLGELILAIWLRLGGATRAEAAPATAGWGGDRAVILRGPDGAVAVGVVTTWDSAADAAEFLPLASAVARALDPGATVVSDGVRRVVIAMGDRAADLAAALAR